MSLSFKACLKRFLPVGFILSPISMGFFANSTAWVYDETQLICLSVIGTGGISAVFSTSLLIYAGVVPQQPPAILTPALTISAMSSANSSGKTS